jgi:hypothetical protein
MLGLKRTGVDSWSARWGSEFDVLKTLRDSLGDSFPKNYYCAVRLSGIFIGSGSEKYEWYLIDDTDKNAEVVISRHAAIKQTSKKSGKDFYQVSRTPLSDSSSDDGAPISRTPFSSVVKISR